LIGSAPDGAFLGAPISRCGRTRLNAEEFAMSETLPGIFLESLQRFRRQDVFLRKHAGAWESIPADRARRDVAYFAAGLKNLGVRAGDRVLLLAETRYEWAVADLAILGLGAITVPLYPTLTAEQCAELVADSGATTAIVSDSEQLAKMRRAISEIPDFGTLVHMDRVEAAGRLDRSFDAVREWGTTQGDAALRAYEESAASLGPDDLATIIYTSGTTGRPKGVMLTHGNIASNVNAGMPLVDIGPKDRTLAFLPLCHIFARTADLYGMLAMGAAISFAESIEAVPANLNEVRPTFMIGVPRFFEKAYNRTLEASRSLLPHRRKLFEWGLSWGQRRARAHLRRERLSGFGALIAIVADRLVAAKIRARFGGKLRLCISGGAPLHPDVLEFFFAIGIPLREGYGLTETSPVIALSPAGREKPGSVGKPIPGVEVRIAENGEILTRGPHVMKGYWKNDVATAEAIRDGWFHTGDIGHLDDEGYLFITDRLKELLVTAGGKKVAPQPVEAELKKSPWIADAVLVGDGRPYIACLLVPDFAALEAAAESHGWPANDRAALIAHPEVVERFQEGVELVNEHLARFEQIKRFEILPREFSLEAGEITPTMKLRRKVIADQFANQLARLYEGHGSPQDAPPSAAQA
jgi:long-chain acyl-CoA synthetase